jgi:hypothetical protein
MMLIIKKIWELLAIDYIYYALGISKFKSKAPFEPSKLSEIKEKFHGLTARKIDDALSYSKELLDAESARGDKIESKAYTLIGVTSVSAAFITGVSSLLPEKIQPIFPTLLFFLFFLFVLIVISFTLTILLASQVVIVGEYKYVTPDIADVFKMNDESLIDTKRERLSTYIYSYAKNSQIHDIKASFLIGSQLWFRNAVVLFLMFAFVLAITIFSSPNFSNSATPTPIVTATSTITITPTLSSTPTITRLFSKTPTAVTVLLSKTPTFNKKSVIPTTTPTK